MAMKVTAQTPTTGYIAWTGVSISYKGATNVIADGNTNFTYVYWLFSSPTTFYGSNAYPTLGDDDLLVFVNKMGVPLTVPNTTIIDGSLVVPDSITAAAIAANTITSNEIAAGAITAATVAAGAIGTNALAANAIVASKIAADTITATQIAAGAIGASEIAANAITANAILAGAITAGKIAANAVTATTVAAGAIGAAAIAAGAISADKISVTSLSAITANLGTITAGTVTGVTINGSTINSTDPTNAKNFIKIVNKNLSAEGETGAAGTNRDYYTTMIDNGQINGTYGRVSTTNARTQEAVWQINRGGVIIDQRNYGGTYIEMSTSGIFINDTEFGTTGDGVFLSGIADSDDGINLIPTIHLNGTRVKLEGDVIATDRVTSNLGFTGIGESKFYSTTYSDPYPNFAQAIKVSGGIATDDLRAKGVSRLQSLELGYGMFSSVPATQAGFFDLHSSGGGYDGTCDFDARIISWGGNKNVSGMGSLQFTASEVVVTGYTGGGYGPIKAASFNVSSKEKFKTNIEELLLSALDKVVSTKVYNYDLIDRLEAKDEYSKKIGLLYEEVPKELHSGEDTIDLYAMVSLSWKAIQELSAKVVELEAKLAVS
jgi:hypothetical protein